MPPTMAPLGAAEVDVSKLLEVVDALDVVSSLKPPNMHLLTIHIF